MPNYQNGMIYKLVNDENDDIYIGSTTQPLSKRFGDHKRHYKYYLNGKKNFITSFNIVKYPSCKIILIEKYHCNCRYELEARERHYIETLKCVNTAIPTRSKIEYRKINKDKLKQKENQRYHKNKNKINENKKQKYIYKTSWGGDERSNNNLLNIKMDLFL